MKRGAGHTVDGLRHLACSTHTPGNQIQLTLKDHFRVVKPRLAVEGMIKHSFEPGKARSLPADHEDAITAFMGKALMYRHACGCNQPLWYLGKAWGILLGALWVPSYSIHTYVLSSNACAQKNTDQYVHAADHVLQRQQQHITCQGYTVPAHSQASTQALVSQI